MHKLIILSIALLSTATLINAATIHPRAGTTSAAFLKSGQGSRAIAMGEAFTAIKGDITSLYWNPAGLATLHKRQFHLTHNESIASIRHELFAYAHPLSNDRVIAGALYGVTIPSDLERRTGIGEEDPYEPHTDASGTFGGQDMVLQGSYAAMIRDGLSWGGSIKIIRQTIDDASATGAAIDAGILYDYPSLPLTLGLSLLHMGTPLKFVSEAYDLPLTVRIGGAYQVNRRLTTTLDFSKPIDNYWFVSTGVEYYAQPFLVLRTGYKYRWQGQELDTLSGLAAGAGFLFQFADMDFSFDYAFTPYSILGNAQRFSLNAYFGDKKTTTATAESKKPLFVVKKEMPTPAKVLQSAPAPVAIPAPSPEPLLKSTDGYRIVISSTTLVRKTLAAKRATHELTLTSKDGIITDLHGYFYTTPQIKPSLIIREKDGVAPAIKHLSFDTTHQGNIAAVTITMRLPKGVINPSVTTSSGKKYELTADATTTLYTLTLEVLENYTVYTSTAPPVISPLPLKNRKTK